MQAVERKRDYPVSAEDIWAVIGGFGALADWHPVIAALDLSPDGTRRTLTLADGAVLIEEIDSHDDAAKRYSYRIVEAPLPLSDYQGAIAVQARDGGSTVVWNSTFVTDLPEAEADTVVGGIYEAGLAALADRFG